jgi:hypothetical protein
MPQGPGRAKSHVFLPADHGMSQISRQSLLAAIAQTIHDYRHGEIAAPDAAHVDRWVRQFDTAQQLPILTEMDGLLKRTYLNKATVEKFLQGLVGNPKLVGANPKQFWLSANFLDIQDGGSSQTEMLQMFSQQLQVTLGITVPQCGSPTGPFIYLDDISFTGNRVRNDINTWLKSKAPSQSTLHVVVAASHCGGEWYAEKSIRETAAVQKKAVSLHWWRALELEDRKKYANTSDVFRPSSLPTDAATVAYVKALTDAGYPPALRDAGKMGTCKVWPAEPGRHLLEQLFWSKGLHIRAMCPNLKETHRPLGYSALKTLGFGSTMVTFRNCPNNCPLVFWAGDPWYPLFPRKNNVRKFPGLSDADF